VAALLAAPATETKVAAGGQVTVQGRLEGRSLAPSPEEATALLAQAEAVLLSCTGREKRLISPEMWEGAYQKDHLRIRYENPKRFELRSVNQVVETPEFVVPLQGNYGWDQVGVLVPGRTLFTGCDTQRRDELVATLARTRLAR
jgi:hypothetical protein